MMRPNIYWFFWYTFQKLCFFLLTSEVFLSWNTHPSEIFKLFKKHSLCNLSVNSNVERLIHKCRLNLLPPYPIYFETVTLFLAPWCWVVLCNSKWFSLFHFFLANTHVLYLVFLAGKKLICARFVKFQVSCFCLLLTCMRVQVV